MKRVKTVLAADSNTKAKVTIQLDSARYGLTRDEQRILLDGIASGVMRTLSNVTYLNVPLSNIKVK